MASITKRNRKVAKKEHFSPIATNWFQGSALEPTDLQALPAESSSIRVSLALRNEAEPREQYVPRQSPGTRNFNGGVSREVAKKVGLFMVIYEVGFEVSSN